MDIGVFGATGVIGSRVVSEALQRGHRVTAFTRDAARFPAERGQEKWAVADWLSADSIAPAIAGLDVVVSAVNAGHGIPDTIANARDFVVGAQAMVAALNRHPRIRLIAVGGGGSLEVAPGVQLLDTGDDFTSILTEVLDVPAEYAEVVRALRDALHLYRLSNRNWTYLSPSSGRINPGARTGRFRIGGDQLLVGDADISAEDLAVALLDEAEQPRFIQRRFTVGY
ncbi:NAD(P)H-binding protein [Nocardia sp. NBC_00508]|uniref:NAD(P)-dependent oxidoreductase n=1 Tax=Nocardia sp. NBC_00508 TaxID=2975992 RepID=UPI002E81B5ED|nr:NAD(P)H-binding protein [Nocardia sp. NBC_00508]WUD67479.1 NAD(P)H-binding protein [Nocardia sp. NBC_00508]